jgi:hypothetical protein
MNSCQILQIDSRTEILLAVDPVVESRRAISRVAHVVEAAGHTFGEPRPPWWWDASRGMRRPRTAPAKAVDPGVSFFAGARLPPSDFNSPSRPHVEKKRHGVNLVDFVPDRCRKANTALSKKRVLYGSRGHRLKIDT